MTDEAVTIKDVMQALKMSHSTFYRLINTHQLPLVETHRMGRKRRFTASSVERLLESRWSWQGKAGRA